MLIVLVSFSSFNSDHPQKEWLWQQQTIPCHQMVPSKGPIVASTSSHPSSAQDKGDTPVCGHKSRAESRGPWTVCEDMEKHLRRDAKKMRSSMEGTEQ